MLEGTDLYSAYAPLIQPEQHSMPMYTEEVPPMKESKSVPSRQSEHNSQEPKVSAPIPPTPPASYAAPNEFNNQFNQYYDNEQRMLAVINELQKRNAAQQGGRVSETKAEPSYVDRLGSKKRDVVKFLQSALIIVFALSVHFLINHYFTWYLSNNDVSFEREVLLRLLYPIGILFVGWNLMLIFK